VTTRGPNPIDDVEVYMTVVLAGIESPGHCTIDGAALTNRWEEKEGDGQDGDSTTLKGRKNAHFTVTFELWDEPTKGVDHFATWDSIFLPLLKNSTSTTPLSALDIYHPDLARLGISAVQVEEIGQLKHDGQGGATCSVKFLEFRPPKPKSGTPGGSKAGGGGTAPGEPPDPNADAQAELDAELAEAKKP
jgi:hypothetical protein